MAQFVREEVDGADLSKLTDQFDQELVSSGYSLLSVDNQSYNSSLKKSDSTGST